MEKNRYEKYVSGLEEKELSLGDILSVERTRLSIERTYLSYTRTAVSFLAASISVYKLLQGIEGYISAVILLVSALYFFLRGRAVTQGIKRELQIFDTDE